MRVLVADLTHGGEVLARRYIEGGHEVTALDIYHTPLEGEKARLRSLGARVLDSAPAEDFDLALAPVHCPDCYLGEARCASRMTYHQAVGRLLSHWRRVEVTGVRGKTSTCHIVAHLLAPRRVLKLTSSGIELYDGGWKVIRERTSIAPTTLLEIDAMDVDFDLAVTEVSLGGTGGAEVGAITNIGDGYAIAQGTRSALEAKASLLEGEGERIVPLSELATWSRFREGLVTYGDDVRVGGELELGREVEASYRGRPLRLPGGFLVPAYLKSMSCALAIVQALGAGEGALDRLASFGGVRGRGEVHPREGGHLIRERNPGVSAASIDHLLENLSLYGEGDVVLALEPVNRKVCEKLVLDDVARVLRRRGVPGFLLNDGGRDHPDLPPIDDLSELGGHRVVVHCTKEGYL